MEVATNAEDKKGMVEENICELVSIVMPSYNTASYIAESIESVLAQTYKNFELLIIDDASSDNTDAVVASFSDVRIKYIKNKKNFGAAESRNKALREAKGVWIAFLDSDDLWCPTKLEKQIQFMKQNNYYFSCTYNDYIDENTRKLMKIEKAPKHVNYLGMFFYNWISCLTVMYYQPVIGLLQVPDLKKRNDYALWLKAIKKADCYCLPEILGSYRVRKQSISHSRNRDLVKAHYKMFRESEKMGCVKSLFFTGINIICAFLRKIIFIKK